MNAIAPGYICTEMTEAAWDTPQGAAPIKRNPMQGLGPPGTGGAPVFSVNGALIDLHNHRAFRHDRRVCVDMGCIF